MTNTLGIGAWMSDLISRQKAINVFEILADKMSDEGRTVMEQAISVLRDLPTAEPERKRGIWIYDTERVWHDGGIYVQYHCSECKFQIIGSLYNYCPYCGAEMRGE